MSEKLQKVLARVGLGSRRELEQWIKDGRVKVNKQVAKLGDRVVESDKIDVDGRPVRLPTGKSARPRVMLYNKPEGEVCTRSDPEGRKTVFDHFPNVHGERWIVVGRLDINSTGLLLFVNDGELANKLMHPSSQIDREYAVRVRGEVTDEIKQRLLDGVDLEDGRAKFTDIHESGGEGSNKWYHVVVMEGRNREVRRLWQSQDLLVSRLKRVRFGNIFMPNGLNMGQWLELTPKEVSDLYMTAGLEPIKIKPLGSKEKESLERQRKKRLSPMSGNKRLRSAGKKKPKS